MCVGFFLSDRDITKLTVQLVLDQSWITQIPDAVGGCSGEVDEVGQKR